MGLGSGFAGPQWQHIRLGKFVGVTNYPLFAKLKAPELAAGTDFIDKLLIACLVLRVKLSHGIVHRWVRSP